MMGLIYVAVAFLSLLSAGQSVPVTNCDNITQRIEIKGRDQLSGKWIISAESTNIAGSKLLTTKFVESAWVRITPANDSNSLDVFQSQKMLGTCFSVRTKMTLENNTLSMVTPIPGTEVLLTTSCPDCIVIYSKSNIGAITYSGLQLLSRRHKLTAAELQEFVKQSDCLKLPSPAILDPEKGLCPDESPTQGTQSIDLTSVMDEIGSEVTSLFDRIVNSEDGLNELFKLFSSSKTGLKEN